MNKYISNAVYEMLEVLDGMSHDECNEVIGEIYRAMQDIENFNNDCFDVTLYTYKNSGDTNA